jgi:hypothetical protein
MRVCGVVTIAGAAAIAAAVAMSGAAPANADPACDYLGWRHPLCGGGFFDSPPDDGIPGDNAAVGGIPAPAMVPNVDGSMSPPGTPGAV